MKETSGRIERTARRRRGEAGFSIGQLVITVAVVGIVTSFGVIGIARTRGTYRLSSATEEIATYMEQARLDSIRRHAKTDPTAPPAAPAADQMASITFDSVNSYVVTMDFDNDGVVEADERRTVTLPDGVTFPAGSITDPATTVGFNWRGRPTSVVSMGLANDYGSKTISISDSGSVAAGDTHDLEGFDVSALQAPLDIPKSVFEVGSDEEGTTSSTGKDKKGDTTTGGGGTTTGGDTTGGTGDTTGGTGGT